MRKSPYKTYPNRYNPQFIGIANKYSSYKQHRINSQNEKNMLHSCLEKKNQLDLYLEKTIKNISKELRKEKDTSAKREREYREKIERRHKIEKEVEQLRVDNLRKKQKGERRRLSARNACLSHNRTQHFQTQTLRQTLNSRRQSLQSARSHRNQKLHNQVFQDKKIGKMHIDQYHRKKNKESLDEYQKRIEKEIINSVENKKQAEMYREDINKLNKWIQMKKHILGSLEKEISFYRSWDTRRRISRRNSLFSNPSCESKVFVTQMVPTQ